MAAPAEGQELLLRFHGADVPLEKELRDALKPNIQRVWNDLQPGGTVDLDAEVRYRTADKNLSVGVRAEPKNESVSIEPIAFPYRMEKLQGVLVYRDGHVTIERFRAEHERVRMAATGYCDFSPSGSWKLHLEGLTVDQLRLDPELIAALPQRLRKVIDSLNPCGPAHAAKGSIWISAACSISREATSRAIPSSRAGTWPSGSTAPASIAASGWRTSTAR